MSCLDDKDVDLVHEHHKTAVEFSDTMPHQGSPETRLPQTPTKVFVRKFFNDKLLFPDDGNGPAEVEVWGFEDETSGRGVPSPLVRVQEGDVFHAKLEPSKSVHTIHWHGIEPVPRNDGVGHTSYEVSGSYTYQWSPEKFHGPFTGTAGTYFYHCHVNTTLHVQMGMFGPLIVDTEDGPGTPGKPARPFVDSPHRYEVEAFWAPYAVDPRWHELGHNAGLSGEDVGLNRFEPKHFYVLGFPGSPEPVHVATEVTARTGQPILIRLLNGTYIPVEVSFGGLTADVIASDGRPFRKANGDPVAFRRTGLRLSPAERYEFILNTKDRPAPPGTYTATVTFFDWIDNPKLATRTMPITITS